MQTSSDLGSLPSAIQNMDLQDDRVITLEDLGNVMHEDSEEHELWAELKRINEVFFVLLPSL